jgi:hypothetical protein
MKALHASSTHLAFFTVIGVLSLSQFVNAAPDGSTSTRAKEMLDSLLAAPDVDAADLEAPLPTQLDNWSLAEDEMDYKEFSSLSLAALPQGRLSAKQPFIDFDKMELGAIAGVVKYSSDFQAGISYVAAVTTRVPVTGISLGSWGLWAELMMAYVNRNLPFFYTNKAGTWFGASLGADFTIVSGEVAFLRAQLGAMFAYWNGVVSLGNGIGGVAGLQLGFHWIRGNEKTAVTLNPQMNWNGKSYILFIPVGFSVDF